MTALMWTPELRSWLDARAREAGFDAAGVAEVREPCDPSAAQEAARFADWVDAGHAGEMEYLKRRDESGTLVRSALRVAMPWPRSVVVCALNYNADAPRSIDAAPPGTGWIARYAWSGRNQPDGNTIPTDYHDELLTRLRRIEAGLLEQSGCETRCYVDTGPLVERSFAVQAGVGWIGKNTCVLNQRLGSWLLLGVIVTSLRIEEPGDSNPTLVAPDRCGTCTRCIDACPTGALLGTVDPAAARGMDASRCIAYLTIEKKGAIDEGLRAPMGRQVFGCDICQDVCPWNRKAPIGTTEGMQARRELINPALDWLAAMDAKEFKRRFKGSPLERTGRKRLLRNVAIAMGNSGEERFLPQLEEWAAGEDGVLAETAAWAQTRILEGKASRQGLNRPV
jgi:epoxyqueuosine reductase